MAKQALPRLMVLIKNHNVSELLATETGLDIGFLLLLHQLYLGPTIASCDVLLSYRYTILNLSNILSIIALFH